MEINHSETSLVIAGAWNPAILTPHWVLEHGLGRVLDGTNRIQAFLPAGQGVIFEFPRYGLDDFTFAARADALVVVPTATTAERIEVVEVAVARMLEQLPHTPVGGVGHNFEFVEANPGAEQLQVFTDSRQDLADQMPEGWEASSAAIVSSFKNTHNGVVVNVSRFFEGGVIRIKVNFHHQVSNANQALNILRGEAGFNRMAINFQTAQNLVAQLYGVIDNG